MSRYNSDCIVIGNGLAGGELCRDTRNCIVTEGLTGLGECHDTISVS